MPGLSGNFALLQAAVAQEKAKQDIKKTESEATAAGGADYKLQYQRVLSLLLQTLNDIINVEDNAEVSSEHGATSISDDFQNSKSLDMISTLQKECQSAKTEVARLQAMNADYKLKVDDLKAKFMKITENVNSKNKDNVEFAALQHKHELLKKQSWWMTCLMLHLKKKVNQKLREEGVHTYKEIKTLKAELKKASSDMAKFEQQQLEAANLNSQNVEILEMKFIEQQ